MKGFFSRARIAAAGLGDACPAKLSKTGTMSVCKKGQETLNLMTQAHRSALGKPLLGTECLTERIPRPGRASCTILSLACPPDEERTP